MPPGACADASPEKRHFLDGGILNDTIFTRIRYKLLIVIPIKSQIFSTLAASQAKWSQIPEHEVIISAPQFGVYKPYSIKLEASVRALAINLSCIKHGKMVGQTCRRAVATPAIV